ncbi:MAG: MBL fold metallo-hydrolase [Chitinophagales bacterium]|nr:MBL fold metallo-hydrolase [Chitinophagales bacterium]
MKAVKIFIYIILILIAVLVAILFLKFSTIGKAVNVQSTSPYILQNQHEKNIRLTYLGTSCFIIDYDGKQLVCDPFFSNPSLLSGSVGKIKYKNLNTILDSVYYNNVQMITVSHGHYDHCLDIASFVNQKDSFSVVTSSCTLSELHGLLDEHKSKYIASDANIERWIYSKDSTYRVQPILSPHGPHFANVVMFNGCYADNLSVLPSKLYQWQAGPNFSYVIDILQADTIYYRMLLNTGQIPQESYGILKTLGEQRPFDMLLPIYWKEKACDEKMQQLNSMLQPKIVLMQHWTNFFKNSDKPVQYLKSSHIEEMLPMFRADSIPAYIMLPFTSVEL